MLKRIENEFDAYVHSCPKDGHCLLHAIAHATYLPYKTGIKKGRPVSRKEIVEKFRKELLDRVGREYHLIAGGTLANSSKWNEESRKERLEASLSSSQQLGEEAKVVIEHFIEKNLLVIDSRSGNLFSKYDYNPSRSSVVLYHTYLNKEETVGHFEMVSVKERQTGMHTTVFPGNHPFVVYLLKK